MTNKDNGGPASDKIQQTRRAAFEAKYPLLAGMYWCDETKQYAGNPLFWLYSDRWEVFNVALDCVVIELPAELRAYTGQPQEDRLLDDDRNHTIKQCRAAIESTNPGIKVK